MLEVLVEHVGGVQFEVSARGLKLLCDQPLENGGFNEGMTPPELLLASLGACAGFYAAEYLRKHGIAGEGTRVHVTAEKAKNPARLDEFVIDVETPGGLGAEHRSGIERAVHRCLIHNTLMRPPSVRLEIRTPGEARVDARERLLPA